MGPFRRFLATPSFVAIFGTLASPVFSAPALSLFAGGGTNFVDGPAKEVALKEPFATAAALGPDGSTVLYTLEFDGRLGRIDPAGKFTTLVCGTNDPATTARAKAGAFPLPRLFAVPHNMQLDGNTMVIADTGHNRVLRLDLNSAVTQGIAGTGAKGFSGDGGPALTGTFNGIFSVDRHLPTGDWILCDLGNRRIRKVSSAGLLTTVAGNGSKGVPTNGDLATASPLVDPRASAVDSDGRVYLLERGGNALRVVDLKGRISTVAGTNGKGFVAQGGLALETPMNGPKHLWCDGNKSVYICDTENHTIWRYDRAAGTMTRVAGTGKRGRSLSPDPTQTELNRPHGIVGDGKGTFYISDTDNHRVLRVTGW